MDKYDRAIAYLSEHPEQIVPAWFNPGKHEAGCLFRYATATGFHSGVGDQEYGCLTLIRYGDAVAETKELTQAIKTDERIPCTFYGITLDTLPVFAEWQRRLDKELNRA